MAHLIEKTPSGLPSRIELPAKDKLMIGRSQTKADVVVTGPAVSGRHCSLTRRGDAFLLADEGSTNGTTLNGAEVGATPVPVWRGDEIRLGDTPFVLQGDDVPERPASAAASGPAPAPVLPGGHAGIRPLGGPTGASAPVLRPAAPPPRHAGPLVATAAAAEAAATGTLHFDATSVGGAPAPAAGFKRKRNDNPVWIAAIVLGALVALGLLVLFLRDMNA